MRRVRQVLQLPIADQVLLIKTFLLVGLVRLGLWLLPFKTLLLLVERACRHASHKQQVDQRLAPKLAWAVTHVSRLIPAATCLTQALAAQVLLRRQGLQAELRIGVVKHTTGRLEAHAWLEGPHGILIGNLPQLAQFIPLPALDAGRL